MAVLWWAKNIAWAVLVGSLLLAGGAYRYFITPPALRFASTEAFWIALSFVGDALLAVIVLLLLWQKRDSAHKGDE